MKPRTAKHLLLLCILLAVIGQWIGLRLGQ